MAERQTRSADELADTAFRRRDLLEPATLVPDEWMDETCALGDVAHCVAQLRRFRDAGADEIATYGSTPGQNAALLDAWRQAGAMAGAGR